MKSDLTIKNGIVIPIQEINFVFSRSGGPGGQHVNRTETRVTAIWNVKKTTVLSDEQKALVIENLGARLSEEGDLIVHNNESRSQQKNKENACMNLAKLIRHALHIPKKRMKTRIPSQVKESRLQKKSRRGELKKLRSKKFIDY